MNRGRGRRRADYDLKNGGQSGRKAGGLGKNRTDNCRHPEIRNKRGQRI